MRTFATALVLVFLTCAATQASILTYGSPLTGSAESPPTGSPGTGSVSVVIDTTANTLFISASFAGLEAGSTASHIHCCTTSTGTGNANVATQIPTFTNMPLGVTSGSFTQTLDLTQASSYNPAFITANGGTATTAEAALLSGIAAGDSYYNIHTTMFPSGEIRGYLTPTAIPEPGTWVFTAAVLLGIALRRRWRD